MSENSINKNVDPTPIVAKSIKKDIDIAKIHLNSHVTAEEEILNLDKNCEYCQIYLKE
jgi:DNA-binding protein